MNASHDLSDSVDRARLVRSGGARDDSLSWNLGRAKQGDTFRVDGMSPRGRGQEECFRVQQAQGQAAKPKRGRMHDQGKRRKHDETSRQR